MRKEEVETGRRINLVPTPEIERESRRAAERAISESRRISHLPGANGQPQTPKSEKYQS